ncbi:FAD/NAD(P)-binding domain-containing protein [Sodiomyces alkalinus F11]|uniref:FAD/NAD(P)-binding domain-containing protein n=1 Tax=Sodiomyces alkalinus (strain CBS 110278 / VKM F-3762 / F11) TaxID=1314773 RepID=A0A3N2Q0G8_SODAK|nr:FAD/NAD(P)-binding domain-containing protein [Sodiomyces alkalinus F11]ROT40232.1 FAD/NAD(P)-binding domain-containing protein [Sodiomyces alkalinus F11]
MGSLPDVVSPFRFLIVGCSYAGLSSALNLLDLCNGLSPRMSHQPYKHHPQFRHIPIEITIVDERDGFFHLIGGPMAFASSDYASKTWVRFQDIPALQRPHVRFVQGSVDKVDTATRTATVLAHMTKEPRELSYDFLIVGSGLRRVFPVVPQSLLRKQFLLEAEEHIHAVTNAPDGVIVVGGGAVGIEMAAELKVIRPDINITLVHSRDQLLSSEGLPDECKTRALELLREAGVEVLLGHRVAETVKLPSPSSPSGPSPATHRRARYEVRFTNGHKLLASEVVMAISRPEPSTGFLPPAALDEEGYARIRPNLFLEPADGLYDVDRHLVVGDAARWSGIKRCGGAMHMGHLAAYNCHQRMLEMLTAGEGRHEPQFQELSYFPPVIGLAVGKKAVACGPEGTISGEDVMQAYFRDDLGFQICWNYMQLGKTAAEEDAPSALEVSA